MEDDADVTTEQLTDDPHAVHRRLRRRGSVVWLDAIGGWLVLGRVEALQAMRNAVDFTVDDPRFTTAQIIGPSMLSTDGDEHQRMRAPFVGDYSRANVADLSDEIRSMARSLVNGFESEGVELRSEYAAPLAAATIRAALGLDHLATKEMLDWYRSIVEAVQRLGAGLPAGTAGPQAAAQLGQAVLKSCDGSTRGLSEAEFASNVAVIMFGAIETSEASTANALWHLLTNPEALARVVADPTLIPNAIVESMRLEPAAAVVDRYATGDVTLGGCRIAKGDYVSISLTAANRDPSVFADGDSFNIDRANASIHLTFAQGPHACLGIHLAKAKTQLAVQELLMAYPNLTLAESSTRPTGLVFRKPERLSVYLNRP